LLTALCPCIRRSRIVNPGTPHASLPGAPAVRPALPPFPTRRSSDLTPRDPPAADVLVRALPGPLLRHRRWWAHQDSNLEPRDSLYPGVSSRSGLSLHPSPRRLPERMGCGTL